jgi:hypothetical protein
LLPLAYSLASWLAYWFTKGWANVKPQGSL